MNNYENFITILEAARLKQCSRPTIYAWINDKTVNSVVICGKTFVLNDDQFKELKKQTHVDSVAKLYQKRNPTQHGVLANSEKD